MKIKPEFVNKARTKLQEKIAKANKEEFFQYEVADMLNISVVTMSKWKRSGMFTKEADMLTTSNIWEAFHFMTQHRPMKIIDLSME